MRIKKTPFKERTCIYLICEDINQYDLFVKIGISNNVELRIKQLDTGPVKRYKILSTYEFDDRKIALENEQFLHKLLKEFNTVGEWFKINKSKLKLIDDVLVEFLHGYVNYESDYKHEYFNYVLQKDDVKIDLRSEDYWINKRIESHFYKNNEISRIEKRIEWDDIIFDNKLQMWWAIFFKQCNIKFDYKPKKFLLDNGVRFTPDFYLRKSGLYIQINENLDWLKNDFLYNTYFNFGKLHNLIVMSNELVSIREVSALFYTNYEDNIVEMENIMFKPGSDGENSISEFQIIYNEELGNECSIAGDWLFDNRNVDDALYYTQWKQNWEENICNVSS
jgi:hypothetical protein